MEEKKGIFGKVSDWYAGESFSDYVGSYGFAGVKTVPTNEHRNFMAHQKQTVFEEQTNDVPKPSEGGFVFNEYEYPDLIFDFTEKKSEADRTCSKERKKGWTKEMIASSVGLSEYNEYDEDVREVEDAFMYAETMGKLRKKISMFDFTEKKSEADRTCSKERKKGWSKEMIASSVGLSEYNEYDEDVREVEDAFMCAEIMGKLRKKTSFGSEVESTLKKLDDEPWDEYHLDDDQSLVSNRM